jgi:hypothetical protein
MISDIDFNGCLSLSADLEIMLSVTFREIDNPGKQVLFINHKKTHQNLVKTAYK